MNTKETSNMDFITNQVCPICFHRPSSGVKRVMIKIGHYQKKTLSLTIGLDIDRSNKRV